ncbi:MAG: RNA polymerase sigma factor RpoD/SigA [Spirochaetia bacterium]|jgi:RNA polymerase primary sigma factor
MGSASAVREKRTAEQDESVLLLYLKEINRIPLLSRTEEESLARAATAGNPLAKEKLIRANLRFVVNTAKKYQHRGLPLEDLISEGNIGLMHAIDRFDVNKGYHFISYAVWWIRQSILNAISEKSRTIRLPVNRAVQLARLEDAPEKGGSLSGAAAQLLAVAREPVSLDAPIGGGEDASPFGDTIEDRNTPSQDEQVITQALRDDINAVLGTLARKEAEIIRARFGLNGGRALSLRELGVRFKLTKERIRQIEKKALRQLQKPARSGVLHAYLDRSSAVAFPQMAD